MKRTLAKCEPDREAFRTEHPENSTASAETPASSAFS
jgi:hypothetical protein